MRTGSGLTAEFDDKPAGQGPFPGLLRHLPKPSGATHPSGTVTAYLDVTTDGEVTGLNPIGSARFCDETPRALGAAALWGARCPGVVARGSTACARPGIRGQRRRASCRPAFATLISIPSDNIRRTSGDNASASARHLGECPERILNRRGAIFGFRGSACRRSWVRVGSEVFAAWSFSGCG